MLKLRHHRYGPFVVALARETRVTPAVSGGCPRTALLVLRFVVTSSCQDLCCAAKGGVMEQGLYEERCPMINRLKPVVLVLCRDR